MPPKVGELERRHASTVTAAKIELRALIDVDLSFSRLALRLPFRPYKICIS